MTRWATNRGDSSAVEGGGGGSGEFAVTKDTLASDFTTSTSWANVGIEVSVTATEGEIVLLAFTGTALPSTASASSVLVGYAIDGGDDVPCTAAGSNGQYIRNVSFTIPVTLTAGTHTIALRAKNDYDGTRVWTISGTGGAVAGYTAATISVTQIA